MRNLLPCKLMATVLAAVCLVVAPGCGRPSSNQPLIARSESTDFAVLFGDHCSGCHGADGKLGPAPPLNNPLFLAIVPDSVLKDVIRHGRPGTLMTSFGGDAWNALSEQQIDVLVSQMRTRWGGEKQVPKDAPPYLAPDSNDGRRGDPAAGAKLLTEICGSCHGKDGRGGSIAGSIRSSAFLALISDQALRRTIITGRPDRGMPAYEELGDFRTSGRPLTSDEVGDLVALLASWREPDDGSLEASSTGERPSAATK